MQFTTETGETITAAVDAYVADWIEGRKVDFPDFAENADSIAHWADEGRKMAEANIKSELASRDRASALLHLPLDTLDDQASRYRRWSQSADAKGNYSEANSDRQNAKDHELAAAMIRSSAQIAAE